MSVTVAASDTDYKNYPLQINFRGRFLCKDTRETVQLGNVLKEILEDFERINKFKGRKGCKEVKD